MLKRIFKKSAFFVGLTVVAIAVGLLIPVQLSDHFLFASPDKEHGGPMFMRNEVEQEAALLTVTYFFGTFNHHFSINN